MDIKTIQGILKENGLSEIPDEHQLIQYHGDYAHTVRQSRLTITKGNKPIHTLVGVIEQVKLQDGHLVTVRPPRGQWQVYIIKEVE